MAVINVRQLSRNTSRVIGDVTKTRRPALIMRSGKPVAALVAVDAPDWEDWVLANAPEFVDGTRRADEDMKRGRTISLDEYFAAQRSDRRAGRKAVKRVARRSPR